MLQFYKLNRQALAVLEEEGLFPSSWETGEQLEQIADAALARLRVVRAELAQQSPTLLRMRETFDRWLQCDTIEYLDRDDLSEADKLRLVRRLHYLNKGVGAYRRFLYWMRPCIERMVRRRSGPVRVLELASGSGDYALGLARMARELGVPLEITGSDLVGSYAEHARQRARERGLPVRFIELDALDLTPIEHGSYDLILMLQSAHHFTAGELARVIAQAGQVGASDFAIIDGRRSLVLLGALPLSCLPLASPRLLADGLISARRFYSEPELELIANLAAPRDHVEVRRVEPATTLAFVHYLSGR